MEPQNEAPPITEEAPPPEEVAPPLVEEYPGSQQEMYQPSRSQGGLRNKPNAKDIFLRLKILTILLGVVVLWVGIEAYNKSPFNRTEKFSILSPYYAGLRNFSKSVTTPRGENPLPFYDLESLFVIFVVLVFLASVVNLMLTFDSKVNYGKAELIFHAVAAFFLLAAGCCMLASAIMIKNYYFHKPTEFDTLEDWQKALAENQKADLKAYARAGGGRDGGGGEDGGRKPPCGSFKVDQVQGLKHPDCIPLCGSRAAVAGLEPDAEDEKKKCLPVCWKTPKAPVKGEVYNPDFGHACITAACGSKEAKGLIPPKCGKLECGRNDTTNLHITYPHCEIKLKCWDKDAPKSPNCDPIGDAPSLEGNNMTLAINSSVGLLEDFEGTDQKDKRNYAQYFDRKIAAGLLSILNSIVYVVCVFFAPTSQTSPAPADA